jgi:hypothetical protein
MDEITACRFTNRVPKKQEVRGNSVFSGSELKILSKNSRSKLQNHKPIAVDVLFKDLSNGTTLMQI